MAVLTAKAQRPYLQAWLRRTRRQLAPSGRLTEAALILSREEGGSQDSWRQRLRDFLDGSDIPSLDLLTRIDALLAAAKPRERALEAQGFLL